MTENPYRKPEDPRRLFEYLGDAKRADAVGLFDAAEAAGLVSRLVMAEVWDLADSGVNVVELLVAVQTLERVIDRAADADAAQHQKIVAALVEERRADIEAIQARLATERQYRDKAEAETEKMRNARDRAVISLSRFVRKANDGTLGRARAAALVADMRDWYAGDGGDWLDRVIAETDTSF